MDWQSVFSSCSQLENSNLQALMQMCKVENAYDLLLFSPQELYELADRSIPRAAIDQLWNLVVQQVSVPKYSILRVNRLCFLNERFDKHFEGGIPSGCLVELAGPSGAGKSNICLQLAISALLSFSDCSVLYLCTDGNFPFRRLFQMLNCLFPNYTLQQIYSCTDRLLIQHLADHETLLHLVRYHLPVLIQSQQVKLIVIDSIVSDTRGEREFVGHELSDLYAELARLLKSYAHKWNLFVVCTNQVVDLVEPVANYNQQASLEPIPILSSCAPCLGLSWANHVNMRLFVWRDSSGDRKLLVLWGLGTKQSCLFFSLSNDGLQ